MDIVIKILQFVVSLSLLVFIHELGHFIAAKIFGVKVEKFYIFFDAGGFSLLKFRIGETEFGVGWVPFGGYCKISGMIDESMDLEQMKEPPKDYEFRSKPAWQRLIIMTGGVIMNVVLAVIIYIGMSYAWGKQYIASDDVLYGYYFNDLGHEAGFVDGDKILAVGGEQIDNTDDIFVRMVIDQLPPVEVLRDGVRRTVDIPQELFPQFLNSKTPIQSYRIPFVVGKVIEESGAERAGIQPGDSLVAFNGREMMFFDEYSKEFARAKNQTVELTVARDSAGVTVFRTLPVDVSDDGIIGVNPYNFTRFIPIQTHYYTFLQSIPAGLQRTGTQISDYWKQLKMIVQPKTEAYKSLGGFLAIGSLFDGVWDWYRFWNITALLSIVLAIMNILPIPALDGGHVLFLLWEVVTGRRPSDKFMEYAQITGLLIIFALLIYANANDIYRFFIK